jgi:hypothetical protein
MGTWGTEIEANDTYADVEAAFLECLAENKTSKELYTHFIDESDFEEEISEETHDWWFAMADLFWKIGYLDKKVVEVVKTIIETKADLNYWIETDADKDDIKERAKVLKAFLKRIATPIKKPFSYDDFTNENELTKGDEIQQTPTNNEKQLSKEEENRVKKMWDEYIQRNLSVKDQNKSSFFTRFLAQFAKPKQPKSPNVPPEKPCFLGGTLIHTQRGLIPIEEIKKDEIVLCYDEIKQNVTQAIISETYKNYTEKYLRIETESLQILSVTGQHLFYQKTTGTWIKAHQLKVGMSLYNAKSNTLDMIIELQVIDKKTTTYNFEVPVHHNYLVGEYGILTHNANTRPTYASTTKRKYAFYRLITLDEADLAKTQYIGKTTREDLNLRNSEHQYFGKKAGPTSKHYWKFADKPQIVNLNKGVFEFIEMTEFESAVWEKYNLEKYRYETKSALKNIQNPLSEKSFKKFKSFHKGSNPCIYFI